MEPKTVSKSKRAGRHFSSLRFIKDTLFLSISPLVQKGGALILLPIITTYLGTSLYGVWQQFNITGRLFLQFCTFTNPSLKKYLSQPSDKPTISGVLNSVSLFVFGLALLIGLVLLGFQDFFAELIFSDLRWRNLVKYLGIYIILEALLNSFTSFFQSQRFTKQIALINSLRKISILLAIAGMTILTRSIEAIVLAVIGIEGISLLAILGWVYGQKGYAFVLANRTELGQQIRFGLPLLFSSLGNWVGTVIDRYFILHFLGIAAVGVYSGSYIFGSLIIFFISPLSQILLPDLSNLYALQQFERIQLRIHTVVKYYLGLGVIVTILIFNFGETLLLGLSSRDFAEGVLPMKILSLSIFLYGLMQILTKCLSALMDRSYFGLLWLAVAGINVIANLILIPRWALVGAASASLLSYSVGVVFLFGLLNQKVALRVALFADVWKIVVGGLAMAAIAFVLVQYLATHFILSLLACGFLFGGYILTLYGLGFLSDSERNLIFKLKKKVVGT